MKVVFMGTPDFAASILQSLLEAPGLEVAAVYCQPDRPAGRGQAVSAGPVKALALSRNLPVRQPLNFKQEAELRELAAFGAEVFVVAAYGLILPQALLALPPRGALNVHASLLPRYRGAAPIQRAIMNGDAVTGISIMRVVLKLDSGPILLQRALGIGIDDTAGQIHAELAALGGRLIVEALSRLECGGLTPIEQDDSKATYAPKLTKADGVLDFTRPARAVHAQARGVTPWPGAQLSLARKTSDGADLPPLQVLVERGTVLQDTGPRTPGTLLPLQGEVLPVTCAEGLYGILRLKPAGGKSMRAAEFQRGYLKDCTAQIL